MFHRRIVVSVLSFAVILLVSPLVLADPPSVVGRLNLTVGPVSFLPGTLDEWAPALPNYPLTAGDHLWTDPGGRAEIHVGSTALRLDSGTEMSFLTLDDQTLQVRLSQGSLNVRVRQLEQGDIVEIDTSNSVVTILQPGAYRIDATPDGEVDLTVRSGLAEVTVAGDVFDVFVASITHISGADSVGYYVQGAPAPDLWDAWCASRDVREDRLQSVRYVSREMIGVEDLDDNGVWMVMAGYGQVWSPTRVPSGWAPYRFGRWAWVAPWGWTWIDDAPWGFAPFHYGRWAFIQSRWVWIPGAVAARPVYAPALVVFVGGSGPDEVGWFPLGPREVYVPAYQTSTAYVQRINVTSVGNLTIQVIERINVTQVVYVNRGVSSALTVVPRQAFVQSRPTSVSAAPFNSVDARRVSVIGMGASMAPERDSIIGQQLDPQRRAVQPPPDVVARRVYSRTNPAPAPKLFAPGPGAPGPKGSGDTTPAPAAAQQRPTVTIVNPSNRIQNPPAARPSTTEPLTVQPGASPSSIVQPTAPATRTGQGPSLQAPGSRGGTDARGLIRQLDSDILPDAEKHLEDARKTKGIRLDYDALRKRLNGIRTALAAAQKNAAAGKDDLALQQAQNLRDQIADVEKIVADALKAAGGNAPVPPGPAGSGGRPPGPTPGPAPGPGRPSSP